LHKIKTGKMNQTIIGLAAVFDSDTELGTEIDEFAKGHNLSRAEALRQILIANPQRRANLERALDERLKIWRREQIKIWWHRQP
jgi:hypothetical protein